jgi:hypothetical protein
LLTSKGKQQVRTCWNQQSGSTILPQAATSGATGIVHQHGWLQQQLSCAHPGYNFIQVAVPTATNLLKPQQGGQLQQDVHIA